MDQFRFRTWQVYKDAQELFSLVLQVVKELPKDLRFEVGSQVIRSSLSVLLNIAEGSGKTYDKELNRFLNIALGSLYETIAAFDALRSNKLIREALYNKGDSLMLNIANQLGGFKRKLEKKN